MTTYKRVTVKPDTPEWLAERLASVGASETPAVLGMNPWQSAYDVYRAKHGAPKPFDPHLAWVGHASEAIIHRWVMEESGMKLDLAPGFMARSKKHPYLHATFDRVLRHGRYITPVQFKTSRYPWEDGMPLHVKVQEQQEMLVAGSDRALVVAWFGGREMETYWVQRDDEFINDHLIPRVGEFWQDTVAQVPPAPMNMADVNAMWPSQQKSIEVTDTLMEAVERRNFLLAEAAEAKKEADAVQFAIAQYMGEHDTLVTPEGTPVLTLKTQAGRRSINVSELEAAHPVIAADFTRTGESFKVLRMAKQKKKEVA